MNKQALDQSLQFIKPWLALRYANEEIPGFAVAVAHKGEVIFNEAYGYASLESKTELTPQHIFRIASHSKTFTATSLMQLQENGKLRIDDYVVEYLPWLKEHNDTRWQKVTIRQIMSHGAGIIRDGLNADYWQLERPFPDEEELKKEVLEAELVLENNIKLKYSNFGYSLLGMVIETVSGISYHQYVTDNIIKPLSLKNTGPEYTPEIDDKLVTGYSRRENKARLPIVQVDTKAMASATGFYSTTEDMCTYFSAQMVGSGKLLSDESKKEMQRVHYHAKLVGSDDHEDYGLGMEIEFFADRTVVGHSGGFPGHVTNTLFDPKDELVVTVLTNCIGSAPNAILRGIYSIFDYFEKNVPTTTTPKHDLTKLEGRYANLWSVIDIVVTGDQIVSAYPNNWQPFNATEKLEYIDDTTFKIVDTGSFDSDGELVHFALKDNAVETIRFNGATYWPEDVWQAKLQGKTKIDYAN